MAAEMRKEGAELHNTALPLIIPLADAPKRALPDGRGTAIQYDFPGSRSRLDMHVIELSPAGPDGKLHFHSRNENFYLILSGAIRLQLGNRQVRLSAGDGAWIPAGEHHAVAADPAEGARLLEIYWPTPSDFVLVERDGGDAATAAHASAPRSDP
jgi:mannose-6-phosphate isomerase-like protein (cupin superfamily)